MAELSFLKLNSGWNADPNDPRPKIVEADSQLTLQFYLNSFAGAVAIGEIGVLTFGSCTAWRLGPPNDEGWYLGQCRYGRRAPEWGEFYEIVGDDALRMQTADWQTIQAAVSDHRHFLFYLRDDTFECVATGWSFARRTEHSRPR